MTTHRAMLKSEFIRLMVDASEEGGLMTRKHDPYAMHETSYADYRSVLSYELADNLSSFLSGGLYNVQQYHDTRHPDSPYSWVINPRDPSFSVPASGVTAHSQQPSTTLDCLYVVSGASEGLHIFGESSLQIEALTFNGTLQFSKELTDNE